jgi:hypothetical protein
MTFEITRRVREAQARPAAATQAAESVLALPVRSMSRLRTKQMREKAGEEA